MNALTTVAEPTRSVLVDVAHRYGMEPAAFEATLRATVCKGQVSREEFAAFLLVAKEYGLNPLTKEIYAFPAKGGGIVPVVSVDGWARIINDHPAFDGMEFVDNWVETDKLISITCRMFRKDRARATETTEYMVECARNTDVWKQWPRRMLRHKALIQCARMAFGFSGIVDQDEYERMTAAPVQQVRHLHAGFDPPDMQPALDAITAEDRAAALDADFVDVPAAEAPSEPAEAPPVPHPAFDLVGWAVGLNRSLGSFQLVDHLRAAWDPHKDALKAANPAMFRELNQAVAKRAQIIDGVGGGGAGQGF